jgi:hypothetical protein
MIGRLTIAATIPAIANNPIMMGMYRSMLVTRRKGALGSRNRGLVARCGRLVVPFRRL